MITGIIEAGLKILDKVLPDPAQRSEAQYRLLQLQAQGGLAELEADVKLAMGQIQTNIAEAGSPGLFVSGWRPGTGWVCLAGLGYQVLLKPLLSWLSPLAGLPIPPGIETSDLLILLTGMLGLGGYRTVEKLQGKA